MSINLQFTGDRIKRLRKSLDLSQREFADRVGVAQPTVSMWELGLRTPEGAAILMTLSQLEQETVGA